MRRTRKTQTDTGGPKVMGPPLAGEDGSGNVDLVAPSDVFHLVYVYSSTLKQIAGVLGWLADPVNGHISASAATEAQFRASTQKIYSSGSGLLDIVAATRLNLGATGDAEFGDGSSAIAIVPTSGSTLDVGTSTKPIRDNYADGVMGIQAGNASATFARVGGTLHVNVTTVGNVGAGEDDLMTYSVPADTLAADKDYLIAKMAGTFTNNANNKRVRAYFGSTVLIDTTALGFNAGEWRIETLIIRTSGTTQRAITLFTSNLALLTTTTDYSTPGATLSGAVTLKCTGEATSNDDITQTMHVVQWFPGI